MMAFLCRVFTCKSKKSQNAKAAAISSIARQAEKENNIEYKQIKRQKTQTLKEVIDNIQYVNKSVKFTTEPNFRYVIPASLMNKISEMSIKDEVANINGIKNEVFVGKGKSFKKNFNNNEICLVSKEIMETLLEGLDADFIIKIPYYNDYRVSLKEAMIYSEQEYFQLKKEKNKNFDSDNNLTKGIIYNKDLKIESDGLSDEEDEENRNEYVLHITSSNNKKKKKNFREISQPGMLKGKGENSDATLELSQSDRNGKGNTGNIVSPGSQLKVSTNLTNLTSNKTLSDKSTNITTKKSGSIILAKLEIFESMQLEPKGLYNPSVYCFMNTCMQCLLSIPELNHYFNSNKYSVEKKTKKGTPSCNALKELIEYYEDCSSSLKTPSSLYKVCHTFLEPNQQHDCQEFLRRFLTKIQEELNYNKKYTFPDPTTYANAWSIYTEVNPSFVDSIFTGLMRSSVICNKCGHKSDTYDPFMDLSVPIKRKPVETLENCLDNYFSKENIDCEYKCSSCKKKTSITKKLEIVISPPILTIHFKRFEDLHHKFNGSIQFRETLDLLTYTSLEVHETLVYELFAVAVHLGRSIFSGHYVAYAKRNGKWYNFNDSSVFGAGLNEALSNNAYILFYRRKE